jgi:hypothetical protein
MFQVFKEVNWSRYYFVILLGLMDGGEAADWSMMAIKAI